MTNTAQFHFNQTSPTIGFGYSCAKEYLQLVGAFFFLYFTAFFFFNTQIQQVTSFLMLGCTSCSYNPKSIAHLVFKIKCAIHTKLVFVATRWLTIHSIIVALSTRYFLFFAATVLVLAHFLKMFFNLFLLN